MAFMIVADMMDDDEMSTGVKGDVYGVRSKDEFDALPAQPLTFRLYDDDGILYYEGVWKDNGHESQELEPLDWAMGYAGCACIRMESQPGQADFKLV